ncbi:C-type lectin-related protein 4 [Elysia marginata]|uniref:C-type lectin-related protein 4 n=1 Tax=Elysia marginata TaxID=1093978 RepID=A0AAV4FUH3_9GAST|nr:C-type lectin-related protein 4 [Elysia marginata]
MYNSDTGLCTPGSYLQPQSIGTSLAPSITEGDLFAASTCSTNDGFTYVTSGDESACIMASDFIANYDDANQHCRDLGSHLFVAPNIARLQLMPHGEYRLIGLTDIDTEGVYVWQDTGIAISNTYATQFFAPGDPNNWNNDEHCILFRAGAGATGVDYSCSVAVAKFVCERPIYNQ